MSIAARRLNCPLPATPYNPPCGNNFQQDFSARVSNWELFAVRDRTEFVGDDGFTVRDRIIQPSLLQVREGIPREGQKSPFLKIRKDVRLVLLKKGGGDAGGGIWEGDGLYNKELSLTKALRINWLEA
jgi:hypothetical protein